MHWFDHITSTIVAAGAVLLLGALVLIRTTSIADGTRLFATQAAQRALTDQIQIDLDNLGIQAPPGAPRVLEASPTRFAFYSVVDTVGTPGLVAYEVEPAGSVLRVRRRVDGQVRATWGGVTRFRVSLLDGAGAPATPETVRQVDVRVERETAHASAVAQPGQTLDPTVGWSTTVRPISLQYPY